MVYDYEECRRNRPKVLAGELDLPVQELWAILYDALCSIMYVEEDEEDTYVKLKEEAVGVFGIMVRKMDLDDDEDADTFFEALEEIMGKQISADKILGALKEAGISFTELVYYRGEPVNIRDFLLQECFIPDLPMEMARIGADMNKPLFKGRTPAYILAQSFSASRNEAPDENEEALAKAAEQYFSAESMETLNSYGVSAAHEAAGRNHLLMLEAMLKKGVDVNTRDEQGNTLLHTACEGGYPGIVKLLIEAGADDTIMNMKEETPAHIAVLAVKRTYSVSSDDAAKTLRELKNIDIPGKDGRTPLMLAQEYELRASDVLTPVLIEMGADVNRADNDGNTALHLHTEWSCDKDVIKAMIKAGYDINARNSDGNTALHFALENGASEAAVYMIKKGADYNIANEDNVTPMQIAVEEGLDDVLPFMGL